MSLARVQFRHIRSFIAVAEERSFSSAARRLCVSQPALSQTIQQLEQIVGVPLLSRTTRHVDLTPSGKVVLDKCKALQGEMDVFFRGLAALRKTARNEIDVGYLIGTGVEYMPGIVRGFERVRPSASLRFVEFDFCRPDAGLATNSVDCAIIRPPIDVDDIRIEELGHERCVACLPADHPLAREATVRVGQLIRENFVAAPAQGTWRDYWLAGEHRRGHPANVVFEAATLDSELQAVATGMGISITAESTAKYYGRPGIAFRPITDMARCSIAVGYRNAGNPLVRDLVAVARDVARLCASRGSAGDQP